MASFYGRLFSLLHIKEVKIETARKCIVNPEITCHIMCPLCRIEPIDNDKFNIVCAKFHPPLVISDSFSITLMEEST